MKNISTQKEQQQAIQQLEGKSFSQVQELKESFTRVLESITPVNIIKTAFHHLASSPF